MNKTAISLLFIMTTFSIISNANVQFASDDLIRLVQTDRCADASLKTIIEKIQSSQGTSKGEIRVMSIRKNSRVFGAYSINANDQGFATLTEVHDGQCFVTHVDAMSSPNNF